MRDETYRAIGRYTVQFSALIGHMRRLIGSEIAGKKNPKRSSLNLALGSLTAQQIADPFFAICRSLADLDTGEQAIEKCLRNQVDQEIRRRNQIAHGDWFVPQDAEIGQASRSPVLVRVKASKLDNPVIVEDLTITQLDEICDVVQDLGVAVVEFGSICMHQVLPAGFDPPSRVRDGLTVEDGRVRVDLGIE